MAPCGAGDPFDCGRRARKSRWKSRAGAESTRLVVLVPKITVLRAWDTQGLFARSRLRRMLRPHPHQRCPRQAHRHRRPRQPCHCYCRQRRFPVHRRRRPRCNRRRPLAATWPPPSPSASPSPPRPTPPSPWPSPSPPSPSPSPLPPLPSPLSPPPPPSPPSPLSRDAAPLSFDRASSRRFDRCAERRTFSLRFWLKAPHKRQIFSRGCRPAPRGGPRSAFFTRPAVSGAHFGSTTGGWMSVEPARSLFAQRPAS